MKEGKYLRARFHSGYSSEGYVYERDIWLKKGAVLTDDGKVLFRETAWNTKVSKPERFVDGQPLFQGPPAEFLPSEPCPWFPFRVDGLWGYGDCSTGEVAVPPQWAFCDLFYEDYARFSAKGDFSDPEKECYDGAWGLYGGGFYDDAFEMVLPPVYQHLSCMQDGTVLAKRDGVWGAYDDCFCDDRPFLPFRWEEMFFAQNVIVAGERTGKGLRYALFSNNYDTKGKLLIDGLTSVTVPEGEPWDGYDFRVRLIERDGHWGVLFCPSGEIWKEPVLSREDAEKLFWEEEGC